MSIAVIGGTGLNRLAGAASIEQSHPQTPFGPTSAPVQWLTLNGRKVAFLARHGQPHRIAPHRINYRANLWALREQGCDSVIAVNAVGGIASNLPAGALAVPTQIIDYTYGRQHTYFDDAERGLEHVDFSAPYSHRLRAALLDAAQSVGELIVDGGVYGAMQGPRLESAAEIDRLERDGCTMVGMTGMPEAALARELGLHYAALCLVVNPAAGRGLEVITMADIQAVIDTGMVRVEKLLHAALSGPLSLGCAS